MSAFGICCERRLFNLSVLHRTCPVTANTFFSNSTLFLDAVWKFGMTQSYRWMTIDCIPSCRRQSYMKLHAELTECALWYNLIIQQWLHISSNERRWVSLSFVWFMLWIVWFKCGFWIEHCIRIFISKYWWLPANLPSFHFAESLTFALTQAYPYP